MPILYQPLCSIWTHIMFLQNSMMTRRVIDGSRYGRLEGNDGFCGRPKALSFVSWLHLRMPSVQHGHHEHPTTRTHRRRYNIKTSWKGRTLCQDPVADPASASYVRHTANETTTYMIVALENRGCLRWEVPTALSR